MTTQSRPKIAVLIAAHNRREMTVSALQALRQNDDALDLRIVVFDDGSTDGTTDAVMAEWPEAVVLKGDGDSFWNRGMHAAWLHALSLDVHGYLWLNDDVRLDPDALRKLANAWHRQGGAAEPFILVGATRDENGNLSYGGQHRVYSPFSLSFKKLPIVGSTQRAETFNGNIVLVTDKVVKKIGIIDPAFKHSLGDLDYGLRASAAGIPIIVISRTIGVCKNNPKVNLSDMSITQRFRHIISEKGMHIPSWYTFTKRHSGRLWPIHFLGPYRKIVFPK